MVCRDSLNNQNFGESKMFVIIHEDRARKEIVVDPSLKPKQPTPPPPRPYFVRDQITPEPKTFELLNKKINHLSDMTSIDLGPFNKQIFEFAKLVMSGKPLPARWYRDSLHMEDRLLSEKGIMHLHIGRIADDKKTWLNDDVMLFVRQAQKGVLVFGLGRHDLFSKTRIFDKFLKNIQEFDQKYNDPEFLPQQIQESFSINEMDPEQAYRIFSKSYEDQTGASWSKDKFLSRATGWTFYGEPEKGFVAVRRQNSGMKKLVGVAGDPKAILKGLGELQQEGGAIWGAVSSDLAKMARKRGMVVPHLFPGGAFFIKQLVKFIPPHVFGGIEPKVSNDGGMVFDYGDVGPATKYLIGNKEYFTQAIKMPQIADKIASVPGLKAFLKLIGIKDAS